MDAAAAARNDEQARPLLPHPRGQGAPNLELLAVEAQHQTHNHIAPTNAHSNATSRGNGPAIAGVVDISNHTRFPRSTAASGIKAYPQPHPKSEVILTSAPMASGAMGIPTSSAAIAPTPIAMASSAQASAIAPSASALLPSSMGMTTNPHAIPQHQNALHTAGLNPNVQRPAGHHPNEQRTTGLHSNTQHLKRPHPNAQHHPIARHPAAPHPVPLAPNNVPISKAAPIAPSPAPVQIAPQTMAMNSNINMGPIPNIPVPAGGGGAASASSAGGANANGNGKTLEPLRAVVRLVSRGHGTAQDVFDESDKYAEVCKRRERDKIKEKEPDTVSKSDKLRNRSRREAKVTKVKQREYQRALQLAIHWLVEEAKNTNP